MIYVLEGTTKLHVDYSWMAIFTKFYYKTLWL